MHERTSALDDAAELVDEALDGGMLAAADVANDVGRPEIGHDGAHVLPLCGAEALTLDDEVFEADAELLLVAGGVTLEDATEDLFNL